MKLLPYSKIEFEIPLSPEEFNDFISSEIEEQKLLWTNRHHKYFQGSVARDWFRLTKIIHYKNAFLPVIEGKYEPSENGTDVSIKIGLHGAVIAFCVIWAVLCGLGAFAITRDFIVKRDVSGFTLLLPYLWFVILWVIANGMFWFEAKQQIPEIGKIIKKTGSEPAGRPHRENARR